MPRSRPLTLSLVLGVLWAALLVPAPGAQARDADREVRVTGTCGGRAEAELRLRADDGAIRVRFDVDARRSGTWRVVLVQDRRVVWRGTARVRGSGGFRLERRLRDLAGADRVSARAWGPRGVSCAAAATLGA